jgi:mono/diheme cytochrome c family protein
MVRAIWCGGILLALGFAALLFLTPARAQNLDEGKSGARLFADSCVTCHHRAKGLTKGRFRLSLYLFLQQHYASNSSAAWELASYLESIDETPRGRPPRAPVKSRLAVPGLPAARSVHRRRSRSGNGPYCHRSFPTRLCKMRSD